MQKPVILACILALSACAQATETVNSGATPAKLQHDTARYFETSPSRVRVGNLKQSLVGTSYKARVAGTLFDCRYFRSAVTCDRAL